MISDDDAPGWAALEAAFAAPTGGAEPQHFGTAALPGQGGLYGLNAYAVDTHWLLLGLGLSDLFGSRPSGGGLLGRLRGRRGGTSGHGLELTLRVPRDPADTAPPSWALTLLQQLSAYVASSGRPLAPGHRMNPGGPITGEPSTRLTGLVFAADPQVPVVDTPTGRVDVVAVVGVTAEELASAQQGPDASQVVAALAATDPLLITDPRR